MKVIILQQAFDELNDAIEYYEEQQNGLGLKLKEEVDHYVRWISHNSNVPKIQSNGYRKVNLKVFPYYIAYTIKDDAIWILAIAHGYRKPQYWIKRKSNRI
ncbi:type II toxin-antitoxin system RelE/ParE family toxin [Desulfobacula sp.]|uniref:type II toxin-antitoxin system RelE/ParE family toxin n=1 Tax=Desulfobacula sp. TaxID=2593537 RepID=UPI00261985F1|nr:type II toxin-antitoxin system RelE/ParE family toxin [Desulfobacula sp.]